MNSEATYIKNRLSLRPPQTRSLEILADLADTLTMKKGPSDDGERSNWLAGELGKIQSQHPTCKDFERSFPSVCFALATGVGKTRLMGAFIAYLHKVKRINNFFVLAPNLTIYNKLITDFGDPGHPKYVFQGIGDFVQNRPRIITGENYREISQSELFASGVHINIFNISKINAETRGGSKPKIRGMIEYLGQPYFEYLLGLDDLVLLMDESHHYRADRGMQVINELNPVLGLELTATPKLTDGTHFKNVVYEYSLAKAIHDGFVKHPAVATRKDFDPAKFTKNPIELDRLKLEDGLRLHEDTKVALDIYAKDNKLKTVKPFVLVVTRDTTHAAQIKDLIQSPGFFKGYYTDKIIEVHSNQRGEERDENIAQLLALEDPANDKEIVIHVNMLKEGWDVTNLYTIVPLRAANAEILIEQTIGRGLRLPYGHRTGNTKADRLTIMAHDRFQAIVDEANKPDSLIRAENIIMIEDQDTQEKEVIQVKSTLESRMDEQASQIENTINDPDKKKKALHKLDAETAIIAVLPELGSIVHSSSDLFKEDIKEKALEKISEYIYAEPQRSLFADQVIREAERIYDDTVESFRIQTIDIPRITIQPKGEVTSGFRDFELDTRSLSLRPSGQKILIQTLSNGKIEIVDAEGVRIVVDSPENIIVNEIMNFPEVDYDSAFALLFKLARQAVWKLSSYLEPDEVISVVQVNKREIARLIYGQMMEQFYYEAPDFEEPIMHVKAFTRIEPHNYTKYSGDKVHDLRDTIEPASLIPSKIFTGFKKACHSEYKFASKPEKDFAILMEASSEVLKWLRPAPNQFRIYYHHNSAQYQPDFVCEFKDSIFIVETKRDVEMDDVTVREKAKAACEYCKHATQFTGMYGGKPWKYALIPGSEVKHNASAGTLVHRFEMQK